MVTENISRHLPNIIEITITRTEKQLMNKNGISTGSAIVGNSRSEGSENRSLNPMSVKYSALNLLKVIITYLLKKQKQHLGKQHTF